VVEHLPHHPKFKGLSSAALLASGERKNEIRKEGGSIVVEHLPHQPKVMGLNLAATAGTRREKNRKRNKSGKGLVVVAQW
jgi:hypothetical protein